jgi:hypothetical protein
MRSPLLFAIATMVEQAIRLTLHARSIKYSTAREQAMAKFKTQRQIEKTANAAVFSGLSDGCGSH